MDIEFSGVIRRARVFVYIPWLNKSLRGGFRVSSVGASLMACQFRDGRGPLYLVLRA